MPAPRMTDLARDLAVRFNPNDMICEMAGYNEAERMDWMLGLLQAWMRKYIPHAGHPSSAMAAGYDWGLSKLHEAQSARNRHVRAGNASAASRGFPVKGKS